VSILLSQFVDPTVFIVKQPRAAITNSSTSMPALTRPLAASPLFPPPNNLSEIGNYPTDGTTTPRDDEREGTSPAPDYAVEYLVWVSDEGSGAVVDSVTIPGKISSGDIEVSYARNSAHQTRFTFYHALNRWSLIDEEIGEISNSTRVTIPDTYVNDFAERSSDFLISVSGVSLTVLSVAGESSFGSPASGTVEFARDSQSFNFNTDDVATYGGSQVRYQEVADGTSTVASNGVATLERNLTITFQENPVESNSDLRLNYSLDSETLSSALSGTKELRLSFVPEDGSTSLSYSPLPLGYTNPLVEGVDYVIDTSTPSIKFTRSVPGEVLASNAPTSPGDLNTSQKVFDTFKTGQSDLVPNTDTLLENGSEIDIDTEYLLDSEAGIITLCHPERQEPLLRVLMVEDSNFTNNSISVYVNGDEVPEFSIVPQEGWINLDDPLLAGDYVTVDYVSGDDTLDESQITGEYALTPAIYVPLLSSTGRQELSPDTPAAGGEFALAVRYPPIDLEQVELLSGSTEITLSGDLSSTYLTSTLLQLEQDFYVVSAVSVSDGVTTLALASELHTTYTNPVAYRSSGTLAWDSISETPISTPEGVNQVVISDAGYLTTSEQIPTLVCFGSTSVYRVLAWEASGDDLTLTLGSTLVSSLSNSTSVEFMRGVRYEGETQIHTSLPPVTSIPDRYDSSLDLMSLSDRFTHLSSRAIHLERNGVGLTQDVDYEVDPSGQITLYSALSSSDTSLIVSYVPVRTSEIDSTYSISYTYYANAPSGVGLLGSMDYQVPDTFYFRVVSASTQAQIYSEVIEQLVKQKSGQVSAGSSPSLPSGSGNHTQGVETPVTRVGDLYDNDYVSELLYDFLTERIGYLEAEKMELTGEVPGGYRGPLTSAEAEESCYGTGRLFPTNAAVLLNILKKGPEVALPARPYRLPVLFGKALEDDGSRLIMDEDYPTIPVVSFPPFPPQGQTYKGSNQEPDAFSVLGLYNGAFAASAPTTFLEHWYPTFLDNTVSGYVNYGTSPATVTESVIDVLQDTGDPSTTTPVFPPSDSELDPSDFSGFNPASTPLPTYTSVASRTLPKGYEGAAIGALQSLDTSIEAGDVKGYRHRDLPGDATSYSDFLGWEYRDNNEYDLLYSGTQSEVALLQAEWAGSRPVDLSALTYNAKQQILVLNLQKLSLQRQQAALEGLIAQLIPVPTTDPELTTVTEASDALSDVEDALTNVGEALENIQEWYDDVIVSASGVASDAQIRARWQYITGNDVSAYSPPAVLPITPQSGSRILQVSARILRIVQRVREINNSLGFDNTVTPDFSAVSDSEDLYTSRFTYLDLRVNRESGTMFKALSQHTQYVRDLFESATLMGVISQLQG